MKHLIAATAALFALMTNIGLAQADTASATQSEEPNLIIYRLSESAKTKGVYYRVSVDGEPAGKLKSASALRLTLAPGEHTITAQDKKRSSVTVTVEAGKTTYVAGAINRTRTMSLTHTQPETNDQAAIAGL
ncbi:hypothetical protein [Halioxenophilus aromaticivorans]|uniref:DUF2846 domain-containing protein n=1 Tax=Halioxenophilus aromaticivorans TaxID=1306992 RepID=A0AAV3U952_9ALTE